MPFKFNPFTGQFDVVNTKSPSTSVTGAFNRYFIASYEIVTIPFGHENLVTGPQTVEGILNVDGRNTVIWVS